jgi:hypothetical protein
MEIVIYIIAIGLAIITLGIIAGIGLFGVINKKIALPYEYFFSKIKENKTKQYLNSYALLIGTSLLILSLPGLFISFKIIYDIDPFYMVILLVLTFIGIGIGYIIQQYKNYAFKNQNHSKQSKKRNSRMDGRYTKDKNKRSAGKRKGK